MPDRASPVNLDGKVPGQPPIGKSPPAATLPVGTVFTEDNARAAGVSNPPCDASRTSETVAGVPAADPAAAEPRKSIPDRASPWNSGKASLQPPIRQAPPAAIGSGQYLVCAKLRIQQVQVALRVLNALMTGLSAQPEDVAKLRSWTDPSHQACSPRDLAQQVVACAASL
jgi:hypothetical protein